MSRAPAAENTDDAASELEEIEIRLLLEGVHLCYGYDFRGYATASLRRPAASNSLRCGTYSGGTGGRLSSIMKGGS